MKIEEAGSLQLINHMSDMLQHHCLAATVHSMPAWLSQSRSG